MAVAHYDTVAIQTLPIESLLDALDLPQYDLQFALVEQTYTPHYLIVDDLWKWVKLLYAQ